MSVRRVCSRREFLRDSGCFFASAGLAAPALRAALRRPPSALPIIRSRPLDRHTVTVVPQYERDLNHLFISIPTPSPESPLGPSTGGISIDFIAHVYDELFAALPRYSEISVAVQARDQARITPLIARLVRQRPLTVHVIEDARAELDLWAQDLGESLQIDGEPRFLVSAPIAPSLAYNSRIARDRALVARTVFGPGAVVDAGFVFEGGNVMIDHAADGLLVLIGYNDLWLTTQNDAARGKMTTLDEAAERVSARFGGQPVVRMGDDRQSRFLPHIDESFVLLADRTAVVTRLPGQGTPEARELAGYATRLSALGYRVLTIESTQASVEQYEASTNAIPFVDRETHERKIIFPVFPGEVDPDTRPGDRLSEQVLRGKARQAWHIYQQAGYQPLPIRDFAHIAGGAAHCISNALD